MVGLSPRASISTATLSPTTALVQALLEFGSEPHQQETTEHEEEVELREEEEEEEEDDLQLVGTSSSTTTKMNKGKEKQDIDSTSLSLLSLDESPRPTTTTTTTSTSKSAPTKSIRNLLRSTTHTVVLPGTEEQHLITSWKMADYAYKRDPCPFPTRARGLFTEKIPRSANEYRIVARGYDKFFNVGEVSWTEWNNIAKHSTAPYELTLKSNGCIIFLAALTPSHVLVTSKHSIGANQTNAPNESENRISHSQKGEEWFERHLEKVGKTKEAFARELWDRNLTAVAELCDDSFEEHVLAYPQHLTGLHLHGLNLNVPNLITLPSSQVTEFAKKWGFIPTPFTIFPSVMAVKTYCETVELLGGIEESNGKITPVEGFVVRGQKRGSATSTTDKTQSFFWKVKYDQPYLMYREWREMTKKLLSVYPDLTGVNVKKVKNDQTKLYLWWVKREIEKDVTKFESWKQGKGIIKTREEFLKWREGDEARTVIKSLKFGKGKGPSNMTEEAGTLEENEDRPFDRWLIAPIAVQGCGKTALGLALSHLFGFSHVQSDDFHMKKSGPHFLKAVKSSLSSNKVVFADKNNHQIRLRTDLTSTALSIAPPHRTKLIALLYSIDSPTLPRDKLHALCASRIVQRGDRHQTLRAGALHEGAIWQFLGQWQEFDPALNIGDGAFDEVVHMKAEWSKEEALRFVCKALAEAGVEGVEAEPSEQRIREAIEFADRWEPSVKKEVDEEKKKAKKAEKLGPRYFAVSVETELTPLLEDKMKDEQIWNILKEGKRIESNPHVTIVHEKEVEVSEEKKTLWDRFTKLINESIEKPGAQDELSVIVTLGPRVVWDSRVVSIEVSDLRAAGADPSLIVLGQDRYAHVTVGTIATDVRPVEGKFILDGLLNGEKETKEGGEIKSVEIEKIECKGKLAGLR